MRPTVENFTAGTFSSKFESFLIKFLEPRRFWMVAILRERSRKKKISSISMLSGKIISNFQYHFQVSKINLFLLEVFIYLSKVSPI